MKHFLKTLLICLFLNPGLLSLASGSDFEQESQEISDYVMSPFCPGRTLSACPSEDARQLRFQIQGWLKKGYSEAAVKRQLIGIYGKEVIGEPEFVGFGRFAWLSPFILISLATGFLIYFLNKTKNRLTKTSLDPVSQDFLEQKLKNL